ncbi:hypothetical protein Gpo141_00002538 [Globisporangium polare]
MVSTPTPPAASTSGSTATSSSQAQTGPTQCRYAGKRCYNARATKRNGSLHNLCHAHRVRANQNQRRMELKRRVTRSRAEGAAHAALYQTLPLITSASATSLSNVTGLVGTCDIDTHLGWFPPPRAFTPQHQLPLPDYSLSAFAMGSVLSDEGFFVDLNGDVFPKDASHINTSVFLHEPQPIVNSNYNTNGYMMHQRQQQQQPEAFRSQSDMWVVPNFLLTLQDGGD